MTKIGDRAALKQVLHDKMLSLEEAELATAIAHYEAHLKDTKLDDREQHDVDDLADSTESAELAAAFDHPVHTHQAKIAAIEGIDFGITERVEPGAVVSFNNRHFVVAVSTTKFQVDGITVMGISVQSPIYQAMEGLKEGDSFTFQGREITLDEVF